MPDSHAAVPDRKRRNPSYGGILLSQVRDTVIPIKDLLSTDNVSPFLDFM